MQVHLPTMQSLIVSLNPIVLMIKNWKPRNTSMISTTPAPRMQNEVPYVSTKKQSHYKEIESSK